MCYYLPNTKVLQVNLCRHSPTAPTTCVTLASHPGVSSVWIPSTLQQYPMFYEPGPWSRKCRLQTVQYTVLWTAWDHLVGRDTMWRGGWSVHCSGHDRLGWELVPGALQALERICGRKGRGVNINKPQNVTCHLSLRFPPKKSCNFGAKQIFWAQNSSVYRTS